LRLAAVQLKEAWPSSPQLKHVPQTLVTLSDGGSKYLGPR
jgi:hypothetical protein